MSSVVAPPASAYYAAAVSDFLSADPSLVLGILAASHSFAVDQEQRIAWEEEITILKDALSGISGTVYLEFDVPRLGSRIDAVLVAGTAIYPIEFKCGEEAYRLADDNQAWDYALDLLAVMSRESDFSVGCYCEDEAHCHRSALRDLLAERGARIEP